MNIMTLDAEYNQPSRKTIQIGAAVYNARNAALIERFEMYVNPYEPIREPITQLTGITDKDVQNAPGILDAYHMLWMLHEKHKCFRNPLVWGSGTRNDSSHIYDEAQEQKKLLDEKLGKEHQPLVENFMGFRVIDVKTIYQSVQLFENSKHGGGLKDSMKRFHLEFEGKEHTALADAMNTFRFWYYLVRTFHDGKVSKNKKK